MNYNEFVLGKLIGSGGFGKVYRASMQADGGTVAVKFLRKAFWQNEAARGSFLSEINLASQINHPGVIRYLSYGESPHGGVRRTISRKTKKTETPAEEQSPAGVFRCAVEVGR